MLTPQKRTDFYSATMDWLIESENGFQDASLTLTHTVKLGPTSRATEGICLRQ